MSQVKYASDPAKKPLSSPSEAPISQQPAVNWQMMVDMNSRCTHQHTIREQKYRSSAFVWACVLCCFANPLCTCIPFCFDGLKTSTTYCEQCKQKIETSDNDSKTAHIVLSVCLIIGLAASAFAVYSYVLRKEYIRYGY